MDAVLVAVGGALVVGVVALAVLVATVATPARRFTQAVGVLRASLDAQMAPLRAGLRRRAG
jgi:hypothetical protein